MKWKDWSGIKADESDLEKDHVAFRTKYLLRAFGCYVAIHRFENPDLPGCLHSHPAWAVRIPIWNGYTEELLDGTLQRIKPFIPSIIGPDFIHRVDKIHGRTALSLWIRGPKRKKVNLFGWGWHKIGVRSLDHDVYYKVPADLQETSDDGPEPDDRQHPVRLEESASRDPALLP